MNIFNAQHSPVKAKGKTAKGENILNVLGNHKQLTPEQTKALQKLGKIKNDTNEFETILGKSTSKNKGLKQNTQSLENALNAKNQNKLLKNSNKDILNQPVQASSQNIKNNQQQKNTLSNGLSKQTSQLNNNNIGLQKTTGLEHNLNKDVKLAQGEAKVARVLKLGESKNLKTTSNNPNKGVENILQQNKKNIAESIGNTKTHVPLMNTNQALMQTSSNTTKSATKGGNNNLVDFNSFMKKQTPQIRGRISAKSTMYQNAAKNSKSMFAKKQLLDDSNKKVEAPNLAKSQNTKQTSLQDVMFSSNQDQSQVLDPSQSVSKVNPKMDSTIPTPKVFDMNQLSGTNTTNEVITKIQDYAVQTRFGNEPQLEVSFKHKDLGQIDLLIQKTQTDQLNISVGANSTEGMSFFSKNQGDLLHSLTQAGVSVGEFKLESGKSSNQNLAGEFGRGQEQHTGKGQQQSQSGERQEEQRRRQEIWEKFQDKEAA